MIQDFGIIIACCFKDYHFAAGCCASIRYFGGDVPICLIVDGDFNTTSLEKTYGVKIINQKTVKHPFLKENSFGWGLTKMIAFWESPWQNFLFLDADTIIWGDVLDFGDLEHYDMIIDHNLEDWKAEDISRLFFDLEGMKKHFPDFNYQDRPYFVTGVFWGKRGIFSLAEYAELLEFKNRYPDVFKYGEQGLLNFMIFRALDEGKIHLKTAPMQVLMWNYSQEEMRQRFPLEDGKIGNRDWHKEACVIHWAGIKPFLVNDVYSDPMTFMQQKFYEDSQCLIYGNVKINLLLEDLWRYRPTRKFIKKLFGYLLKSPSSLFSNT
ncbi:hypothetical protein [Arthrospira platensis]|uniref:Glycosyl transferase family 8 n=1 Tax=Limnospira platensis NIES-46 TaxID=1236695 RepID=A0A5M3T2K2_LIMPL|nr:hypothetical protein [Arthrospira platensis]AMW30000.1 hypothetical protein AP285_20745 [Arthrospira platensis YZ]KDR53931.1 hypothetical protein APPUASWS_030595 [Arthrospira platensis str. Paraca]MBD2670883.1 hypothetical protein [Arthrospira platensis FACHB-439]MBD2712906.1 hypothetical protein [Arthrospira platensis FACHB-835]MDF2211943.1 hypothetical protein [Arthrospira platensis NCB002]MDT9184133.1 hypothetical protein [Limnospira sp. PMC 289.06]MDT9296358.1 hypothetical protein [Ar